MSSFTAFAVSSRSEIAIHRPQAIVVNRPYLIHTCADRMESRTYWHQ